MGVARDGNGAKIKGCKFTKITIFYSSFFVPFSEHKVITIFIFHARSKYELLNGRWSTLYYAPHAMEDDVRRDEGGGGDGGGCVL